jgi:hypothetical protein
VRLLVERLASIRSRIRDLLDIRGEVVEALRAHEESVDRPEQRGLAAAILTDEERDPASKRDIDSARKSGNVEGIFCWIDLSCRLSIRWRNGAAVRRGGATFRLVFME